MKFSIKTRLLTTVAVACVVSAIVGLIITKSSDMSESTTILLSIVGSLATGLAIAWIASGWIKAPLEIIGKEIRDSLEKNRLPQLDGSLDPEILAITVVLDDCQNVMKDLVQKIGHPAGELATAAADMQGIMERTEASIFSQQNETNQVATAMNEMSSTVEEVARNASEASGAAHSADEAANNGLHIARETVKDISHLVNDVQNASGVISKLEEESNHIGVVLDVIKGIAEQTNLLALNAAIEAARAGEQGRGFAVVADEVRMLATRTQESTQEIEQMIGRLQEGVRDAVSVMKVAQDKGEKGAEQVQRTLQGLEDIKQAVTLINDMNAQIATAAEEQSQVANEINRNIVNINEAANTSAEDVSEARAISEKLAMLSNEMFGIVQASGRVSGTLDLSAAKAAHLNWKTRLRSFLDGKEALTMEQAVSHHHCDFGKWYYSDGLKKFGHLKPLRDVEKPHEELHELIREIIQFKENGQDAAAEQAYSQVASISEHIVSLLDAAEREAG